MGPCLHAPPTDAKKYQRVKRTGITLYVAAVLYTLVFHSLSLAESSPEHEYRFFHLTIREGLSQSTIRAVLQDSRGFLWIGTQGGLDRYDGYEFTRYRYDPEDSTSISDNSIRALAEDGMGYIWVGTNGGGVNRMEPATGKFRTYRRDPDHPDKSIQNDFILSIHVAPDSTVWVGTRNGLARYDRAQDVFRPVAFSWEDQAKTSAGILVSGMSEDGAGGYWLGTYAGLYHFNSPDDTLLTFVPMPTGRWIPNRATVRGLYRDSDGTLWLATEQEGLFHYNSKAGKWTAYHHDPKDPGSLSSDRVWDIHRDRKGRLWVATNGGLSVQEPSKKGFTVLRHKATDAGSLGFDEVHCITEDRDGTLWFGTFGNGLSAYNDNRFPFLSLHVDGNSPVSLTNNHVMAITSDRLGGIWVGTDGGGVNRFEITAKGLANHSAPWKVPTPPGDRVWSLLADSRGRIWMGTFGEGLARFDPASGQTKIWRRTRTDTSGINNYVADIMEDRDGTIWFATLGDEIASYNEATGTFRHYRRRSSDPNLPVSPTVRCIFQDGAGRIWYGSNDGLHLLDPETGDVKTWSNIPSDQSSLAHNVVLCIYEDSKGRLWVGTRSGGLNLMDPKTGVFIHYGLAQGLPDDMVYGILEDGSGTLWISTNKGLCRFNPETDSVVNYTAEDGLQANEFNQGAFFKDSNGALYFGGIGGLTWFKPDSIQSDERVHPVVLTRLMVMNRLLPNQREAWSLNNIRLPYDHNDLSLEFAALNFVNPYRNLYRYTLEGYDRFWNESGHRRYAAYTNIPPGKYVFRVRSNEIWGGTAVSEASLNVEIVPPFWRTPLFFLAVSVLLIGSISAGIQWRVRSIRLFSRHLQSQVQERTELLARSNHELETKTRELEKMNQEQGDLLEERKKLIGELQEALKEVKTLSGLVPICASCKKVRDDQGYWNQVEIWIEKHSEATFTHGICPECKEKALNELHDKLERENGEDDPPPQSY
ncbi:MAG: two-component regulator propeller domain-containing protein [bacterium]